jgi:hypothetical protein
MDSAFEVEAFRYEYKGKGLIVHVTLNSVIRRLEITYNDSLSVKLRTFAMESRLSNRSFGPLGMLIANELIKLRLAIGGKRLLGKIMSKLTFEQIKDQLSSPISRETAEDFLDACTEQVEALAASVRRLKQKTEESAATFSNSVTDYDVVDFTPFSPQPLIDATVTQLMKCIDVACNAVVIQGLEEALGTSLSWETLETLPYKEIMKVIRKKLVIKKQERED